MSYADILAARGYRRAIVERTAKEPGHIVLKHGASHIVPGETAKVTPIRRGRVS